MGYVVGISSGWWYIGRDPNLLGLVQKAGGFGATGGVRFNQIDLETTAEFLEPRVRENMKRIQKQLGIKIGMHGEIGFMSALESAERRYWEQSHIRLVETVKHAAELGIVYINLHSSSTLQLQFQEAQLKPFGFQYQVVTPYGKPFYTLCEKSKEVMEFVKRKLTRRIDAEIQSEEPWGQMVEQERKQLQKQIEDEVKKHLEEYKKDPGYDNLPEVEKRRIENQIRLQITEQMTERFRDKIYSPDFIYEAWKRSGFARYLLDGGEIDAYIAVAYYMKSIGDPLWTKIAKGMDPEKAYTNLVPEFNAAIAAKYIEGHLTTKDHEWNRRYLNGMSVLEWLEKHKLYLCFETPEVSGGNEGNTEGLYRLYHPLHIYHMIKKINSEWVRMTIDFEHVLSQKIDVTKLFKSAPNDFGKTIIAFHIGEPKPYKGVAHIPIPLNSEAQEIIYSWLYEARKKGFMNGYLIFERGSGRGGKGQGSYEVFENTVWVLRKIVQYLEKDIEPEELPPEFYGISVQNKETFARQLVTIRDHAWDPLKGVLMIPEEEHTFLSRAAVEKGKHEEWAKRKYR